MSRRRLAWSIASITLASSACFVDPGTGTASSPDSAASTSTAPPGDTTSAAPSTSAADTTSDTTGDPGVTTGSACAPAGGACDDATPCCGCRTCSVGVCVAGCADCQICEADACVPGPDDAACTLDDVAPCDQLVFGAVGSACFAYAPAAGATCKGGACQPPQCSEKGAMLHSCPKCVRQDNGCIEGAQVNDVGLADFCHVDEASPDCRDQCDNFGGVEKYKCTADAECSHVGDSFCGGNLSCTDGVCPETCNSDSDCIPGFYCDAGDCVV